MRKSLNKKPRPFQNLNKMELGPKLKKRKKEKDN